MNLLLAVRVRLRRLREEHGAQGRPVGTGRGGGPAVRRVVLCAGRRLLLGVGHDCVGSFRNGTPVRARDGPVLGTGRKRARPGSPECDDREEGW